MYGYPVFSEELQRELDEGRIVLGGCVVTGADPAQKCRDCGLRWGGRAASRGAGGRRTGAAGMSEIDQIAERLMLE